MNTNNTASRRTDLLNSAATLAILGVCAIAAPALAQTAPSVMADPATQLDEVVVTAQRRSENLQDVPLSVTALSETALQRANIASVTDLGAVVPSLNITNTNGKVSTSLRGIGSTGIGPGFENPVAIYLDGVFLGSTVSSFLGLADVMQVDVLKGPQGTLFGRNATGGLIQVTTRTPTQEPALSASIGYGSYDTVEARFYAAGGLAAGLAASITAFGLEQGDGWGTNRTTGADTYRVDHNYAVRGKLAMDLGTSTRAVISLDYTDESRNDLVGIPYPGRNNPFFIGPVPDLGYDQLSDAPTYKDTRSIGGSVTIDQEIGTLALKSITAYRDSEANVAIDVEQSPRPVAAATYRQPENQFSQEFQIQPRETGRLGWIAGLYYFNGDSGYDPLRIPNFGVTTVNYQRAESLAGYAQATYELIPGTKLTLGGRYTEETRTEHGGGRPDRDLTFDNFTVRVALDHQFTDDILGYASYNSGFKSGGFNTSTPGLAPFRPETIDAYEVGLKTDLFDRRARFNVAAYYYDYTDIQNFIFVSPVAVSVQNAASAEVYGLDADFRVRATSRLELSGGFGLNSAEYGSYPNAPIGNPAGGTPPVIGNAEGNSLPLAAKVTANLAATYTADVAGGELAATVNGSYNSGYHFEADNVIEQPDFYLLGANLDWTPGTGGFSVGVYGRNLTDERVVVHSSTSAGGAISVIYGAPRTYGVALRYKY